MASDNLFAAYGGRSHGGHPAIDAATYQSDAGTLYLQQPGAAMLSRPNVNLEAMRPFLEGFDAALQFPDYLADPTPLPDGAALVKAAAQLCYASFGRGRTTNANAARYFDNIRSSGHGSVLEHACYSFLCYGVSRSLTHELIRHRAGFGFSQISQRYVSGKVLRFVERPEYMDQPDLHAMFLGRIDRAASEYAALADRLLELQAEGDTMLTAEARTDLRKKVQQCARSLLPNETEAPLVVTANARAWRHFIEMRANPHAEIEIRNLAFRVFLCLREAEPVLFADYTVQEHPDGTHSVFAEYQKV
jgi:thymidylate synthase (FAD)